MILKPDHVRDVDLFVRWYGARAFGPSLFWRGDVPQAELEPVRPGDELPGGLLALDDGRGMVETPLYLPEQRALVFADGLTAPGGELRVWASAQHEERALPALRELLELPFEHVLVSHGEPVHTRADFERRARARAVFRSPRAISSRDTSSLHPHDQDLHRRSMSLDGYIAGPEESGFDHLFQWYGNGDWSSRPRCPT